MKCPDCDHEMDMMMFTQHLHTYDMGDGTNPKKAIIIHAITTCNQCGNKYSGVLKKVNETIGHTAG